MIIRKVWKNYTSGGQIHNKCFRKTPGAAANPKLAINSDSFNQCIAAAPGFTKFKFKE